jgi:hypothetical protein
MKTKPTKTEIALASKVFYNLHYQGMLTPEQESLLENATEVMEQAGLLDENGEPITED